MILHRFFMEAAPAGRDTASTELHVCVTNQRSGAAP